MSYGPSPIAGSRVVVFGGTGHVGWGVAKVLLEAGATVIAPTRAPERADAITRGLGGDIRVEVGEPSSLDAARALVDRIEDRHGPVQHVVASLGGWWQKGRIVDQPEDEYRAVMRGSLDVHVFAAQAFLRRMADRSGSSYTIVTGQGATLTLPNAGLVIVAAAGLVALSRYLRAEHAKDAIRVNEIMIATRIEREAGPGILPAEDFGRAVAQLLESQVRSRQLRFERLDTFTLEG